MTREVSWTEVQSRGRPSGGPSLGAALARRKGLLAAGAAVGLLLGGFYLLRKPPEYASTAQVLLVRSRLEGQAAARSAALELPVPALSSGLLRQIRQADWIRGVIDRNHLAELPSLSGAADPAQTLLARLSLTPIDESAAASLVELRLRGPAADDCRRMLEAVAQACLELVRGPQQEAARELARVLEQARGELSQQIRRDEKAYDVFRKAAPDLGRTADAARLHEQRIGECGQARSAVLKVQSEIQPRIASIEDAIKRGGNREALAMLVKGLAVGDAGPAGPRAAFDQQLFAAQLEERQLLAELGGDHPRVQEIRRKTQLLREKLGIAATVDKAQSIDFVDVYLEWLREELRLAQTKLREIDARLGEERASIGRLDEARRSDERLRAEIDRSRGLFDAAVKRLLELSMVDEEGRLGARLVAPPDQGAVTHDDWLSVLGIAGGGGLFIGLTLSWLLERAARRYRFAARLQKQWGTTVLGRLPGENRGQSPSASLCTVADPQGAAAAAHCRLHQAVERQIAACGGKVIAVSSAERGQGAALWAANLAVLSAQAGRRVLLVDADLRRSRLHQLFALDNSRGLSSTLAGEAELAAVIRETSVAKLWATPAGPPPDKPADLLISPRLRAFFDSARPQFDEILVVVPPVLDAADAALVAVRCDAALLVVPDDVRQRPAAIRSLEILHDLGTPLLGAAFCE